MLIPDLWWNVLPFINTNWLRIPDILWTVFPIKDHVSKYMSGFLNSSQQGTLFIGVKDDG
jgi:hypothetical protein